jgi:hypothetical protein
MKFGACQPRLTGAAFVRFPAAVQPRLQSDRTRVCEAERVLALGATAQLRSGRRCRRDRAAALHASGTPEFRAALRATAHCSAMKNARQFGTRRLRTSTVGPGQGASSVQATSRSMSYPRVRTGKEPGVDVGRSNATVHERLPAVTHALVETQGSSVPTTATVA